MSHDPIAVLRDLLEWAQQLGGWEAPVWDRARECVEQSEDDPAGTNKFGVVWSDENLELVHTGYVFVTKEQAIEAGRKGLEWFRRKWRQELPYVELGESLGTGVSWTADECEVPTGFYVDHGDNDDVAEWHEAEPAIARAPIRITHHKIRTYNYFGNFGGNLAIRLTHRRMTV